MSSCRIVHVIVVITSALLFLCCLKVKTKDPTRVDLKCQGSTFERGSTYESNLKALISSLSFSNNSSFATGFMNVTSGISPYAVYGLFLCRADISVDVCKNCVAYAANDTLSICPEDTEAIVWYDECMLHYSDRNFFGLGPIEPAAGIMVQSNTSKSNSSEKDCGSLRFIYKLIDDATRSEKLYAADSDVKPNQTNYGLVQCARDIDATACGSCLKNLTSFVDVCHKGKIGWQVLGASCMLRYEAHLFFNLSSSIPQRNGTGDIIYHELVRYS